jgi:hypothetical protein
MMVGAQRYFELSDCDAVDDVFWPVKLAVRPPMVEVMPSTT